MINMYLKLKHSSSCVLFCDFSIISFRDDKVRNKILRLFKIWDERSIYDEAFLMDLSGLLSSNPKKPVSSDPAEFQVAFNHYSMLM